MTTKALVILSGGQDSTTCLYWAKERYEEVHALTFDYGQRHLREIDCARKIATMAGCKSHEVLQLGPVLRGASPLVSPETPLETYTDFNTMDKTIGTRVELTFVPMRNALFLVLAANRAHLLGCSAIVTGVSQEDNANYPDCRMGFIATVEAMIASALGDAQSTPMSILSPVVFLSKAKSISLARSFPGCMDALAQSHTCYKGEYPPCGECHACVLRAHGFEEAGVEDPLIARARAEAMTA